MARLNSSFSEVAEEDDEEEEEGDNDMFSTRWEMTASASATSDDEESGDWLMCGAERAEAGSEV